MIADDFPERARLSLLSAADRKIDEVLRQIDRAILAGRPVNELQRDLEDIEACRALFEHSPGTPEHAAALRELRASARFGEH